LFKGDWVAPRAAAVCPKINNLTALQDVPLSGVFVCALTKVPQASLSPLDSSSDGALFSCDEARLNERLLSSPAPEKKHHTPVWQRSFFVFLTFRFFTLSQLNSNSAKTKKPTIILHILGNTGGGVSLRVDAPLLARGPVHGWFFGKQRTATHRAHTRLSLPLSQISQVGPLCHIPSAGGLSSLSPRWECFVCCPQSRRQRAHYVWALSA